MPLSTRTEKILETALADKAAATELASAVNESVVPGAAIPALTVTATAGTLPVANGSVTVAAATTPTVNELLEYCQELNAKVNALRSALTAAGITA
jgi:hypothetical protein